MANTNQYQPGDEFQCLGILITVTKTPVKDQSGVESLRCGFSIAGGVDQDHTKSPQKFQESGIYVTRIEPDGPADRAGLKSGDKILECNGHDFTLVTHKKACEYIKMYPVLEFIVLRKDDCVNV